MRIILRVLLIAVGALAWIPAANAGLFTTNYGGLVAELSDCDDCASSTPTLFGGGQSINFFGNNYTGLYISSNGYLTFDAPHTRFDTQPIDTQTVGPMIAGLFTDLDTTADSESNVYVNNLTVGEIIVTYEMVFHSGDNTMRSTFQLLVRSDQKSIPAGEGQLGFFYGDINDSNLVSAGFGDGLITVDPLEVSFASDVPGITLSNNAPRFYTLEGGGTVEPPPAGVPEPASLMLIGVGMAALAACRFRLRPRSAT
jgi:hypothetical protein